MINTVDASFKHIIPLLACQKDGFSVSNQSCHRALLPVKGMSSAVTVFTMRRIRAKPRSGCNGRQIWAASSKTTRIPLCIKTKLAASTGTSVCQKPWTSRAKKKAA